MHLRESEQGSRPVNLVYVTCLLQQIHGLQPSVTLEWLIEKVPVAAVLDVSIQETLYLFDKLSGAQNKVMLNMCRDVEVCDVSITTADNRQCNTILVDVNRILHGDELEGTPVIWKSLCPVVPPMLDDIPDIHVLELLGFAREVEHC